MKKIILIIGTPLVIAGWFYFTLHNNTQPASKTDISTWKTYQNTEFGFSIKYPPHYVIKEDVVATSTQWGSRGLLTILRYEDTTPQLATPKFHIVSAQVTLQRQPVVATGKIYHTIVDYQKSGTAAQMVQGAPHPDGELVTVNGIQALAYHLPPGDVVEVPIDSYFFIKNDLIYHVYFTGDDPNGKMMLQSIMWQ